ncbi:MAG: 4Fe-4S binding protein [Campylobacter sp.]|nr:4Fe-4S binding protein [Campylobacter sp.]
MQGDIKPPFKPRSAVFGINDWIKSKTAKDAKSQKFGVMFFKSIIFAAPYVKTPLVGNAILKVAKMGDKRHTAGFSMPLNIDLKDSLEQKTLPLELLTKVVTQASYRAIIKTCMCRETFKCRSYPTDFGCLFIGEGARAVVQNGIAYEAGLEECLKHIRKSIELKLAAKAFWVEVEEYVWGVKDKDMQKFLEICFCCPCCCAAFKFSKRSDTHMLVQSSGWLAKVNDELCVKCGKCVKTCPTECISLDEKIIIDDNCSGCGLCIDSCDKTHALSMFNQTPMKEDVKDYFDGLNLQL